MFVEPPPLGAFFHRSHSTLAGIPAEFTPGDESLITRRRFVTAAGLAAADIALHSRLSAQSPAQNPVAQIPVQPKAPILDASALAPFVDPLPIPAIAQPAGTRPDPDDPKQQISFYRMPIRETLVKVHRDLPPTRMWTIGGSFPGPTLETPIARGMIVEWQNQLPKTHLFAIDHSLHGAEKTTPEVRAVIHLHGGRTPPASDGYPEDWTLPGHAQTCHYPSLQHAATLFYHDHTMGINRLNTYAGMVGFCILRDAREAPLGLPTGRYDIPLLICDRILRADGQLDYPVSQKPGEVWVPEVFAETILANGKLLPYLDVEPTLYRFRLMNGSNGRFFRFSLADKAGSQAPAAQIFQIASDQGLLAAPVPVKRIVMAPAERADILIDFSSLAGQRVELISDSFQILEFRVAPTSKAQLYTPLILSEAATKSSAKRTDVILSEAPTGAKSKNPLFTNSAEALKGHGFSRAVNYGETGALAPEGRLDAVQTLALYQGTASAVPYGPREQGALAPERDPPRRLAAGPTFAPVILSEAPTSAESKDLLSPSQASSARERIPAALHPVERIPESAAVRTRRLTLDERMDDVQRSMGMLLNNTPWHAPITEKPVLYTTEIWELVNLTDDSHPIHLHLVRFQILDRRRLDTFAYINGGTLRYTGPALPPAPEESGWKDTVRADPAMVTRIIIPFEGYPGRYVWHCHILEHEDNEMMRPFEVVMATS
jgi:FtsP/CotA-like multicopper oxidase with cupredoxin domain